MPLQTDPPMPPSNRSAASPIQRLLGLSDQSTKALASVGVVFYALGLLVANIYYSQFGIVDFSILKPQCILTGIWSLLFIACASSPSFALLMALYNPNRSKPKLRPFFDFLFLVTCLASCTLAACFFRLILGISPNTADTAWLHYFWNGWSYTPPGWGYLLFVMNFLPVFFIVHRLPGFASKKEAFRILLVSEGILALIGSGVIGLALFPAVSRAYGGGRPQAGVTVYFAKDGANIAGRFPKSVGHPGDGSSPDPVFVDIVLQTSDVMVLRSRFCDSQGLKEIRSVVDRRVIEAYDPGASYEIWPPINKLPCE